jgi:hypothetical protein
MEKFFDMLVAWQKLVKRKIKTSKKIIGRRSPEFTPLETI